MSGNAFVRRGAYAYHGINKRLLGRFYPSLRDLAVEIREVSPAELGVLPAPVTVAGNAERATGVTHGEDVSVYVTYATMTTCTTGGSWL